METLRPLNIRYLKLGELYTPMYAGECINTSGQKSFFGNPIAVTLSRIMTLPTDEAKFDFFCYAYLREASHINMKLLFSEQVMNIWKAYVEKYGMPWFGGAKNIIPDECFDVIFNMNGCTEEGLNKDVLRDMYNRMADYEYVIYKPYSWD